MKKKLFILILFSSFLISNTSFATWTNPFSQDYSKATCSKLSFLRIFDGIKEIINGLTDLIKCGSGFSQDADSEAMTRYEDAKTNNKQFKEKQRENSTKIKDEL